MTEEITPTPTTAELLQELIEVADQHLYLPPGASMATALWIMHTWVPEANWFTPRLILTSPNRGCGKTSVLHLLERLSWNAQSCSSLTSAVLYRLIENRRVTLLIDEADTFLAPSSELNGVLNAGYEKNGTVMRCVGDSHEPTKFRCFCPVAVAAIGHLPATLVDRGIPINMTRKPKEVSLQRLRGDQQEPWATMRARLEAWATSSLDHLSEVEPPEPDLPTDTGPHSSKATEAAKCPGLR